MNSLFRSTLMVTTLCGCGTQSVTLPKKLNLNPHPLPQLTTVSGIAEDSYRLPSKNGQLIEKFGRYKVKENIYIYDFSNKAKLFVPKESIITGTYANNGVTCNVIWGSIYANENAYKTDQAMFDLHGQAEPTKCDPARGITKGYTILINIDDANNGLN